MAWARRSASLFLAGILLAGCGAASTIPVSDGATTTTASDHSDGPAPDPAAPKPPQPQDPSQSLLTTPLPQPTPLPGAPEDSTPLPAAPADTYSPASSADPGLKLDPNPGSNPAPEPRPAPDPIPSPQPPPKPTHACASYPMGIATLPSPGTSVCGNGKAESGEACDDGNTIGNDTCTADCKKSLSGLPLPQICQAVASPAIVVTTTSGVPIANATVSIFTETTNNDTDLRSRFPYTPFSSEAIRAVGKTNAQGKFIINPNILIHSGNYFALAAAPGYLSKFTASLTCGSLNQATVATLALENHSGYATKSATPKDPFYPVRVDTFHYSSFEREDRDIVFPYVPLVRGDLCDNLSSVDVTLHVTGAPTPGDLPPKGLGADDLDPDFHTTVSAKDVALFRVNSFRFKLPAGVYYFYFEFALHRDDGSTETKMFYPQRAGYSSYPDFLNGAAPTSGNSLFYTFFAALIVYPADYLAAFSEASALTLQDISGGKNADAANRLNIIVLNQGFDAATFTAVAQQMIQDADLGLFTVAPFADNAGRINVWGMTENLTQSQAEWPLSNDWLILGGGASLTKSQFAYLNGGVGAKPLMMVLVNDPTVENIIQVKAGSGFCAFKNGVSISLSQDGLAGCLKSGKTAAICAKDYDLPRVFLHELGHELAMLGEEYYAVPGFFDIADYEATRSHFFTPYYKPNTAFPEGMDVLSQCHQTQYSYSSLPGNTIVCADATATDFCKFVPWHDLVGKEGTGCYLGGGPDDGRNFANFMKPHPHSIMDMEGRFYSQSVASYGGHVYGIANERSLCRAIQAYTGSVGGGCNKLCMQGCAVGMQCDLNGKCVYHPSSVKIPTA